MDREKCLRRVALLYCHFTRNCAYYRAGWDGNQTKATNEFWATAQGNFIDMAVLEWLKLFGDHNDKHHWKKVMEDKKAFKQEILYCCAITEDDLAQSRESFKTYRDKFVAHLDSGNTMHIPVLDIPLALAKHYYKHVSKEIGDAELRNLPRDIDQYYQDCFQVSGAHFGK